MTTSQVIQLTHCVDLALIARMFARFRGRYGNLWTSRANCDEDWEFIMEDWLHELSKFTIEQVRSAVNKTLSEYVSYPPTLGQLVELCMKESGVPETHDVMRLMTARDFSHPLVKMIYDKIGSWMLTNGKTEDIERKVKEHYQGARSEFYVNPEKSWSMLEAFNAKPKELPQPDKIATPQEYKSFKERLAEYQQKLQDQMLNCPAETYREFDEQAINPHGKKFDQKVYDEYRRYLLSIPEEKTHILPVKYIYARGRFINQREQPEFLRKAGYNPNSQGEDNSSPRPSKGPNMAYKSWVSD